MRFDEMIRNDGIEYGIVRGNAKTLFIKTGLGTDRLHPDSKYLTMARDLHEIGGISVLAATNPQDGESHAERDKRMLEQYLSVYGGGVPELFFFGNSNGCIKGLELTEQGVEFRRMVLVNMPLMINFHKTKRYLSAIPQTEVLAVFGELDPSFAYVPFLDGRYGHVKVLTVPYADHNFMGMTEEFVRLGRLLMDERPAP